jgi:hypothetical protein
MNFKPEFKKIESEVEIIEDFCKKYLNKEEGETKITLEQLKELKEKGITTERFLDHLYQKYGLLMHGSIQEIKDGQLKSKNNKVFGSNKSAIAIMRSLFSNVGVNLSYPYFISEENPLILQVRVPSGVEPIIRQNGFVYIVEGQGFVNDPEGSWQYVKNEDDVKIKIVVETEKDDFKYPVKIVR